MSSLDGKLEEYLAVRRAMGFKMERHEKLLGQFAGFLAGHGETAVTGHAVSVYESRQMSSSGGARERCQVNR